VRATTRLKSMVSGEPRSWSRPAPSTALRALVEQAGFPPSMRARRHRAQHGRAGHRLISPDEIVQRLTAMVEVVSVPVIADADTGYGNALSASALPRLERAGVAAFHLEDQTFPKKCGHYENKGLVPTAEMVQKLHAVRDALHDPDFIVIGAHRRHRRRRL